MRNGFIGLAILGTVVAATNGAAVAQTCPPGQILQAGTCQPATAPGAAAAVSAAPAPTAAATTTAPATATAPSGTVTATTPAAVSGSTVTPAPVAGPTAGAEAQKVETCPAGLALYNHGCYPTHDAANAMVR
jgi:hypothetical protein